ncbi:MAG TPA: right-handed parallel beta-helix repeat-containing protein, partial [Bacteroidota bacterium]|nr:right-handed parallel beta-helix repeat-containing protein [Bacteroidota bacterium]
MKYLRLSIPFILVLLMSVAVVNGQTIQSQINAAPSGGTVTIGAGTFNEALTINKPLTLTGAGSSTVITPPSGNGISISGTHDVTIQNLKVTGASDNGIYAHNVVNLTIAGVTADLNGNSAVGSGIYVDGITGTSALNNITATNNQVHGVSIGDGSSGVTINGGTFTGNGVSANTATGGGINIHSVSGAISSISVIGTVNSSSNMNAGIIVYGEAASGSVSSVSIGATGTITLSTNGSGTIGEGVAVAGNVTTVSISGQFTEGSLAHGAGVAVVGTDNTGSHSPSGVTISNSNFAGYSSTTPAITLADASSSPNYISVNPVTATTGITVNGSSATGFQVEDLVYHKLDNASLGLVTFVANNIYVTANSGSIQRGINAATLQTVNVGAGTYAEAVNLNKAIALAGVDSATVKINPPAASVGITISASGASVSNLTVWGATVSGISASGKDNITLTNVVSQGNGGSGAQFTNCTNVTVSGGKYYANNNEGFNATGGGGPYTVSNVSATWNGNSNVGSGFDLKGTLTGSSVLTNLTASQNHHHGVTVGDGASNVTIDGGTFNSNGVAGDATTGGGINIIASGGTTTSNIAVQGTVTANNNQIAGIFIFSDNAVANQISTVTIGASGTVAVSGNGSTSGTYGSGGAGVLIYGIVSNVHISNTTFTKSTAPGAGIVNIGEGTQASSPTGSQVANSSFVGYTSAFPAVSLTAGSHSAPQATNDVSASNNSFTFPVAAKVFLQGPFSSGSMTTNLGSLVPLTQPYNASPFSYAGTEHVATIPASTVDWILLELRSSSTGTVAKRAAFLKNDGTIMDTNGVATVAFTQTQTTGYTLVDSIVVMHRNHIAVISANGITLPNETSAYDFTTAQSK